MVSKIEECPYKNIYIENHNVSSFGSSRLENLIKKSTQKKRYQNYHCSHWNCPRVHLKPVKSVEGQKRVKSPLTFWVSHTPTIVTGTTIWIATCSPVIIASRIGISWTSTVISTWMGTISGPWSLDTILFVITVDETNTSAVGTFT